MKKTLITGVLMALFSVVLTAEGVMAIPTSADYWAVTDATTGVNGSTTTFAYVVNSADSVKAAAMDIAYFNRDVVGSFGLYSDLDGSGDITFNERFKVVDGSIVLPKQRKAGTFFQYDSGQWKVSSTPLGAASPFSNIFGFYFSDKETTPNYYYTDSVLNGGNEFLTIDYDYDLYIATINFIKNGVIMATVDIDDVTPIPEPTSMLLLGTGLVGLASVSRKRMKKPN